MSKIYQKVSKTCQKTLIFFFINLSTKVKVFPKFYSFWMIFWQDIDILLFFFFSVIHMHKCYFMDKSKLGLVY